MTIGIALKDNKYNRIILGADKQVTCGIIKSKVQGSKIINREINIIDKYSNPKGTKKIYFLFSGYGFIGDYIKYSFEIPDFCENYNFTEYLYDYFLEELREGLISKRLLGIDNEQFNSESSIIIVFDGELYIIDSHFGVNHMKNYAVIGSGDEVAIGSLYTNLHFHSDIDKMEMVKQAIISCGVNTIYCDANFDLKVIEL